MYLFFSHTCMGVIIHLHRMCIIKLAVIAKQEQETDARIMYSVPLICHLKAIKRNFLFI